jgi:hypothetical protein
MKDIGIAIIDVYEKENLNLCYQSLRDKTENLLVVSNTLNPMPENSEFERFSGQVPFATLRNYAINYFRTKGMKHVFLINSNIKITEASIFENTIKTANTFGVWFILGPSKSKLTIEDDEQNLSLNLSEDINSDFIYIFSGIISNVGFFDDRCFNTKSLDVLDYIIRMRNKNVFPPTGYVPYVKDGLEEMSGKITKPNHQELKNDADQSVNMAYAYFYTNHKYIPTQNDPKEVEKEKLMESLEYLQKNYSKKL